MKKIVIAGIALIIVTAALYGLYQYNRPHEDIANKEAAYATTVDALHHEFVAGVAEAGEKYSNEVIVVSGVAADIKKVAEDNYHVLLKGSQGAINCEFSGAAKNIADHLTISDSATVKGLFIGYNDLLQEIQLKQCILVD